ncbi:MAG: DUF1998 domain-containing protein [Thaumarchaeota archaeon]|nr:DUF1998 domain-containing protein [Nitrososphaerota archaeon]
MAGQAIRPSQFVFTFGVGSIIEAPGGPRIIKDFSEWGRIFGAGRTPSVSDFKIPDSIASALLDNGLIFRIPTNVELTEPDAEIIFSTGYFPNWALCIRHDYLYQLDSSDRTRCPRCTASGHTGPGRAEAIRFVKACPDGHMDDVDWYGIVHSFKKDCNRTIYNWRSEGGSLRNLIISCECGDSASMSDVYNRTSHCTGRFPEKGTSYTSCQKKAEVTLRGSSSLRIPEIISTITLPRFASRLHRIFDDIQMRTIIAMKEEDWTKSELQKSLETMSSVDPTLLDPRIIDEIKLSDEARLLQVIKDVKQFGRERPTNIEDIRREEFRALQESATLGHPPDPTSENPEFQVNKLHVRDGISFGPFKLRITPVDRLRVVIVQKGYRRLGTDPNVNKLVPTFYYDGKRKWFPGLEQIGEGIFIDFGKTPFKINSPEWEEQYSLSNAMEYSPTFVWWHTLSHRIISALSIDSGYSSAAIRESVYTVLDKKTGELSGGILLYTAQSGGDGTLGGLISLVPQFENVLDTAIRNLDFCSNDPLCSEEVIRTGRHSGASCYACLLLSETSCAHRNMYLDRNLLGGSIQ